MPSPSPLLELSTRLSTLILADDLTGACDSAATFAARGMEARVALNVEGVRQTRGQVVSFSLETRNLRADEAAERTRAAAALALETAAEVLFCKIDSAGRGPVGEAVLNVMNSAGCDWAIVTPAFPDQERTMRGGVLNVAEGDGSTRQILIDRLFPRGSHPLLGRLPAGNAKECERQMKSALNAGRRILLCDAETREDLAAIVDAARRMDHGRALWCGSAGLAQALANTCFSPARAAPNATPGPHAGTTCLLFAGTPHSRTAGQIRTLTEMDGVLQMECGNGLIAAPSGSRCIVATVTCGETTDAQVQQAWESAQRAGGTRAIVLTGGDTASMVLRALQAESILVRGEIASGIPWGVIESGIADGYRVVTKSGGFGTPTALVEIVQFLERMP